LKERPKFLGFRNGHSIAYFLSENGGTEMIVATGLAIFVVVCLLLAMVQTPPEIGR
jgi:hypothetical protein